MSGTASIEEELKRLTGLGPFKRLPGGRTNLVWSAGELVIKLYRALDENPLFSNSPDLEWTALNALKGEGIAPEPIKRMTISLGEIVIYRYIEGNTGFADVGDAAELLGRLHTVLPPEGLPVSDGTELGKNHPKRLNLKENKYVFLHRDPVFSNLINGPSGLMLVDWQCPALGDPVEDLAHFLSPAMNVLYRGKPLGSRELERFLSAYPSKKTVKNYRLYGWLFHQRLVEYCTWRVTRGHTDYASAKAAEMQLLETLRTPDHEIVNG